jgi:hypothetical protein
MSWSRYATARDACHPDMAWQDPLSDEFQALWTKTARENADHFDNVFRPTPSRHVTTWAEYKAWVPQPPQKVGHVFDPNMKSDYIRSELGAIRGKLVEMPLNLCVAGLGTKPFTHCHASLEKEELQRMSAAVNVATMAVYL